ncbi:uncharacterized protein SCODWIG_01010 [Saccharomycodes ludwigii]|uniref:Uncharacterized protein n=2 Tax=Saccharomycodes ludwigii TaxID=36035 RepID=A0A376B3T6_9ASCO|nr:uncharacterized protein SCODWIG_01010 [Saccharomycodes ludwigii]
MIAFTWYSIYLVVNNMTIIESSALRAHREELEILHDSGHPDPMLASRAVNIFDLGSKRRNWDSVMGSTWMEWLFPITTYRQRSSIANGSYDDQGLYFPVDKKLKRDIQLQNRLLTRLTPRSSMDV